MVLCAERWCRSVVEEVKNQLAKYGICGEAASRGREHLCLQKKRSEVCLPVLLLAGSWDGCDSPVAQRLFCPRWNSLLVLSLGRCQCVNSE